MLGLSLGPISGPFSGYLSPATIGTAGGLGSVLNSTPVYSAPAYRPPVYTASTVPARKDMANLSGAVEGGASGAGTGAALGGGYGALLGGVIGAVTGLFKKKDAAATPTTGAVTTGTTAGGGGLLDALSTGLKSLGIPSFSGGGSSMPPLNIVQNQSVSTDVNVNNVLGGQPFGGVDPTTGEFDTFKLLSDVFTLHDAMQSNSAISSGSTYTPSPGPSNSGPDLKQTVLIAAAALAAIYFLTKGKTK